MTHYWKQKTDRGLDLFILMGDEYNGVFKTFDQLCLFCKQHGINARQA